MKYNQLFAVLVGVLPACGGASSKNGATAANVPSASDTPSGYFAAMHHITLAVEVVCAKDGGKLQEYVYGWSFGSKKESAEPINIWGESVRVGGELYGCYATSAKLTKEHFKQVSSEIQNVATVQCHAQGGLFGEHPKKDGVKYKKIWRGALQFGANNMNCFMPE